MHKREPDVGHWFSETNGSVKTRAVAESRLQALMLESFHEVEHRIFGSRIWRWTWVNLHIISHYSMIHPEFGGRDDVITSLTDCRAYQALNVVTDFAVYLWPARTLSNRNLPMRKRGFLIFAFLLGCAVFLAGLARLALQGTAFHTNDLPFYTYRTLCAAVLEVNLGVMCASLVGCRPVAKEVKHWFTRSFAGKDMIFRTEDSEHENSQGRNPLPHSPTFGPRSATSGRTGDKERREEEKQVQNEK